VGQPEVVVEKLVAAWAAAQSRAVAGHSLVVARSLYWDQLADTAVQAADCIAADTAARPLALADSLARAVVEQVVPLVALAQMYFVVAVACHPMAALQVLIVVQVLVRRAVQLELQQ
jgi:S1-C subfamily serine protease